MGGRSKFLSGCTIAVAGQYKEYPVTKVSGWISGAGGTFANKVSASTTHLVASTKAWQRKDVLVKAALKLNLDDDNVVIHIVSFDWLEDSLTNKSKKREGAYSMEKLEAAAQKKNQAAAAAGKKGPKGVGGAKNHVGMMQEVFEQSTDKYVDEKEKKKINKQIEEQEKVRKAMEEQDQKEKEAARREKAKVFGKGAKKARNEIFTENHHIYMDDTGFKFDVPVTKVDTRHNKNERYVLTIYESNAEPATYATNVNFAKTDDAGVRKNTIIAPVGSTYPPAFRAFKNIFQEKTGVAWDDRISFALQRSARRKRDRGQGTGSDAGSAGRKGVPVSTANGSLGGTKAEMRFEDMPFEYHPPRFGARGKLPKDKAQEIVEWDTNAPDPEEPVGLHEGREKVEVWMSGANGVGPGGEQRRKSASESVQQHGDAGDGAQKHQQDGHTGVSGVNANAGEETFLNGINEYAEGSAFDRTINEAVEETYPFEDSFGNYSLDDILGTGTNAFDEQHANGAPEANMSNGGDAEGEVQRSIDGTQQTSFANPPSTVRESFQPDTQDVGETQIAARAAGEFAEFIGQNSSSFAELDGAAEAPSSSSPSKRKRASADLEDEQPGVKKLKPDEGDGDEKAHLNASLKKEIKDEEASHMMPEETGMSAIPEDFDFDTLFNGGGDIGDGQ